jgi:excisionase family DNA binding protein
MEIGVKEVASQLGVSERRVRQLVDAGALPARRVAGRLLVEESGIPRSRLVARPMSPRIAWAFIALLSGEAVPDVSDRELARLEGKCRSLLEYSQPAVLLRSWLRSRAGLMRLAVSPSDVEELLQDSRLIPSGISDARSEMSAGREAEAYVRPDDVERLLVDHLMAEVRPANVWLHIVDRQLERPAPLGLVIADLADHDRAREDARIKELLGSLGR